MAGGFDSQSLPLWALQDGRAPPWQEQSRSLENRESTAYIVQGCMTPLNDELRSGLSSSSGSQRCRRRQRRVKTPRGIRRDTVFDNRQGPPQMGFRKIAPGFTVPFGPGVTLRAGPAEVTINDESGMSYVGAFDLDREPTGERGQIARATTTSCVSSSPRSHLFSPVPFPTRSSFHPFHPSPSPTMSANEDTHRGASADGEKPQTLDTQQSGVNPGTSRPSTSRLSANVPAFVPTPTRSGVAGAPKPAMPTIRELTALEAVAETRAWYAQEGHSTGGAHAATVGYPGPGTQYDNSLYQASSGPHMHLSYHGPSQPSFSLSQANTGFDAAYADARATVSQSSLPPLTPARQMGTGPGNITSSFSNPFQDARPATSNHPPALRTPVDPRGPIRNSANTRRTNRAVQGGDTVTPCPPQHAAKRPPSAIPAGDVLFSNYAQWEATVSQRRAPAQYEASVPVVYPSILAPAHLTYGSFGRNANQRDSQRRLEQSAAVDSTVHNPTYSTYVPKNFSPSIIQMGYPTLEERAPNQRGGTGSAAYPSALTPEHLAYESFVRRKYQPGRQSVQAEDERAIMDRPPIESIVPSGYAPWSYQTPALMQSRYPIDQARASAQHAVAASSAHSSGLALGHIPPSALAQQPYPINRGRPTQLAISDAGAHTSTVTPDTMRSSSFVLPTQHAVSGMGVDPSTVRPHTLRTPSFAPPPQHTRSGMRFDAATFTPNVMRYSSFAPPSQHTVPNMRVGASSFAPPPQHTGSGIGVDASAVTPQTMGASTFAPQAYPTVGQRAYPAVAHDPSNIATPSFAGYFNAPRPARPLYPGHEYFTREDVESYIRRIQDEDWLRTARHDAMLAQQHARNRERPVPGSARPEQRPTVTERTGTTITEAGLRALEQRRADRIRRDEERERAVKGIPDPQESADRAQFQRIVETYNYRNYSETPVNPRLPNAHIVASDPANQELVSDFETALSNMALYRRGYALFPGSLHSQINQDSTVQATTGERRSRRITDNSPDWNDPAMRENPEIRHDILNSSTLVSFMGPTEQTGHRPTPHESEPGSSSDSTTLGSSANTSATPMDTPTQSERTPVESATDEGGMSRLHALAALASREENTSRYPASAVPVSEDEKTPWSPARTTRASQLVATPQRPVHAGPAPEQEKTSQSPVHVAPTSEEEKTPRPSTRTIHASQLVATPQRPVHAGPAPEQGKTSQSPVHVAPTSEEEKTPRPSARTIHASQLVATPQRPVHAVPEPKQEETPRSPVHVAPTSDEKTPRPAPAVPVSEQDNISRLLAPLGLSDFSESEVTSAIGSIDEAISSTVAVPPASNRSIGLVVPPPVTYANVAAGRIRVPRPSPASEDSTSTEDQLRSIEAVALARTSTQVPQIPTLRPSSSEHEYAPGAHRLTRQYPYNSPRRVDTSAPASYDRPIQRMQRPVARRAAPLSRNMGMTPGPTVQTTDSAIDDHEVTGGVSVSQTQAQGQDASAEGTLPHEPADPTKTKRRDRPGKRAYQRRRTKKRRERAQAERDSQQESKPPNDEVDNLPTEAQ